MNIKNARWIDVAENLLAITVDETEWRGPVADHIYYPALIESGVEIAAYAAPAVTWDEVRAERNQLLAGTDFHALSDVTMTDEMTAYRQALRDVPADNADPDDISWPTKP